VRAARSAIGVTEGLVRLEMSSSESGTGVQGTKVLSGKSICRVYDIWGEENRRVVVHRTPKMAGGSGVKSCVQDAGATCGCGESRVKEIRRGNRGQRSQVADSSA